MIVKSENKSHEATCNAAEMTRQVATAAAAGNPNLVLAADAAFFRSVIASCVANNVEAGGFRQGLHNLTGSWT
jgi:hypothetical protein